MKQKWNLSLILLLVIISITTCEREVVEDRKVIVQVGNQELALEDLEDVIPQKQDELVTQEQIQNYIHRWIDNELIYQEALRLRMDESAELVKVLRRAEKEYLIDKLLDSLMTEHITIPEQEIINYYEMNKDNFIRGKTEIKALHILVPEIGEANSVRRRIIRGEEFDEVAREVSLDYKKKNRIELGYFSRDDVVPEIASSLFRWRVGSVTRPIKSEFGYHIFKIIDKKEPNTVKDYDEVRNEIIERLLAKRRDEMYKDFITSLKSKVEIKTNFDYLKTLYKDSMQDHTQIVSDSLK